MDCKASRYCKCKLWSVLLRIKSLSSQNYEQKAKLNGRVSEKHAVFPVFVICEVGVLKRFEVLSSRALVARTTQSFGSRTLCTCFQIMALRMESARVVSSPCYLFSLISKLLVL
jgi:hypothetical protein